MVNQSKINDDRFWKKWNKSGAVGISYTHCKNYNDLVLVGALRGLDEKQKLALVDYMYSRTGCNHYGRMAKTMIDFLKHPDDFVPNDFTMRSAYVDFVIRRFDDQKIPDGRRILFPNDITTDEIDLNRLKDVAVEVGYRYSSTLRREAAVVIISGYVRKDLSSEFERRWSGGVTFSLDDFVQRKNS